ncbi:hypothetical protein JCM8547_005273 [Rhodosporidiobolus lusitaniae]
MRISPLWLVASAGVLASAHNIHDVRSVGVTPAHAHALEERGLIGDLLGGLLGGLSGGSRTRCPKAFVCNGKGNDGYYYDIYGARPSWVPSGWLYFGVDVEWAPSSSWSCASSWTIPSYLKIHKATWFAPSAAWKKSHLTVDLGLSVSIPSWWNFVQWPTSSWTCSGSGNDGWEVDYQGKSCPSKYPSGWRWFGRTIGWAPPAGWSVSASFEFPSAFISVCDKVTWWKPSSGWLSAHVSSDLDFTPPSWWGVISVPSKSWQCNGTGKDGWSVDYNGNSCPTKYGGGSWLWFGSSIGWAPSVDWSCSASFELPSAFVSVCDKVTWWKPSSGWLSAHVSSDLDFTPPSWWGVISVPSKSWQCNGTGKDGWSVDYNGNSCPTKYGGGSWLWFGSSIGWAPSVDWSCSASFELPSAFVSVCDKVTWWKPSSGWLSAHVSSDLDFTPPSWWGVISVPSKSWQCNGTGKDGWSVDYNGNSCPTKYGGGSWLWFGSSIGWAPSADWSCSASFEIPSAFVSVCDKVTWWKPSSGWLSAHVSTDLSFTPPSWWGVITVPSRSWRCDGSGTDGFEVDWQGNTAPSWAYGWLWFGTEIGWGPASGWSCSSSWTVPTQWKTAHKCSWWKPSSGWRGKHRGSDFSWSIPSWWGIGSCGCAGPTTPVASTIATTTRASTTTLATTTTTTRAAVTTTVKPTTTSRTTTKAATTTTKKAASTTTSVKKTTTTSKPKTTTTKAATTTSKPKTTTSAKATTTSKPKTTTTKAATTSKKTTTSKAPAATTTKKTSAAASTAIKTETVIYTAPTVTISGPTAIVTVTQTISVAVPTSTGKPSSGWQCDGSGDDGYKVDHNGNSCPSHYGGGEWLWWGTEIGWAPHKSWSCGTSWQFSSAELTQCGKVSWFVPPAGLVLGSSQKCPFTWTVGGWIDKRIPSKSFTCDGSGHDGFDFDHQGNSRPAWTEVGWRWFGTARGWQPCTSWQFSSSWSISSQWNVRGATWWAPSRTLTLRSGFRCPKWWSSRHLRGSWRWW